MAKFQYGKTISDSFKLIFSNLYIFVPLLVVNVISLLSTPIYFKLMGLDKDFNVTATTIPDNIVSIIVSIILIVIILIILNYLAYGWTFALIGQIIKKGKADLFKEFGNATRKGWRFFLISLIGILISIALIVLFGILIAIMGLVSSFSNILGIILIVLLVIALLIAFVVLILLFMYVEPLLALEDFGVIKTIKLSFSHFRNNKAHSLALLGIIILFSILAGLIMYAIMFLGTGSISNEAQLMYMIQNPITYSIASFFSGLPNLVLTIWSFAFLTIAYVRKKGSKK